MRIIKKLNNMHDISNDMQKSKSQPSLRKLFNRYKTYLLIKLRNHDSNYKAITRRHSNKRRRI